MADKGNIAAEGAKGVVVWAIDARGRMPAREYFDGLAEGEKAKVLAVFQLLADQWKITNPEKFGRLGSRAKGDGRKLFKFKSFQQRFLGDYRPGFTFVVAHGTLKKKDDMDPTDIATAVRVLAEHDKRGERGE